MPQPLYRIKYSCIQDTCVHQLTYVACNESYVACNESDLIPVN